MANIDELSRIIGQLESSVQTLFRKHDTLCKEIKTLSAGLQKRRIWDSVKIVSGACIGGFAAVVAKFAIWGK